MALGDGDGYDGASDARFSDATTTAHLVTYFGRLHWLAAAIAI